MNNKESIPDILDAIELNVAAALEARHEGDSKGARKYMANARRLRKRALDMTERQALELIRGQQ